MVPALCCSGALWLMCSNTGIESAFPQVSAVALVGWDLTC